VGTAHSFDITCMADERITKEGTPKGPLFIWMESGEYSGLKGRKNKAQGASPG